MMHNAHLIAHGFIGIGSHNALIPPSVVPVIAPHIAVDTLLGLTINAKYSKTVFGPFGIQLVGKENDSGYIVPHFCIPPNNLLIPVIIAFGESKVMFSASTVKIDVDGAATPVACCVFPVVPLSLNQACNEPCNYPSDIVIAPNSVVVGMTLADIIAGLVATAFNSLINFIAGKIGDGIADAVVGRIAGRICERLSREFVSELAEMFGKESAERMGREIVENMLERPIVQFVREAVAELIEEVGGNAAGGPADAGARAIGDGAAGDSSAPPAAAPAPATGSGTEANSLTGADGSNPRVFTAA